MNPLIVEFLGTQGSGKTTLLPAVKQFLLERKIEARTVVDASRIYARRTLPGKLIGALPNSIRAKLLWQVFYQESAFSRRRFIRQHPDLIAFVNETQSQRPASAGLDERKTLFWFNQLIGYYQFLTGYAQQNEALIFDDGFVHRVVHLNASAVESPDPAKITKYLDLIPQADILIVPRVALDICVERVIKRGVWEHFRGKDRAELRQYLANSESIVNMAVEYLRKKNWNVIEVDNGGDNPSAAGAELRLRLEKILSLANQPQAWK